MVLGALIKYEFLRTFLRDLFCGKMCPGSHCATQMPIISTARRRHGTTTTAAGCAVLILYTMATSPPRKRPNTATNDDGREAAVAGSNIGSAGFGLACLQGMSGGKGDKGDEGDKDDDGGEENANQPKADADAESECEEIVIQPPAPRSP